MTEVKERTDDRTVLRTGEVDASAPPRGERLRLSFGMSHVLLGTSALLVWALLYLLVLSGLEQGHAQSRLYQELRTELALGTAPTGAPIAAGHPVALLSIADAGVEDLVVVEGSRPNQLQDGPGHVLGSVLPGQRGVSVVAGKALSFGAPFARLADLRPGDPVSVTTGQGTFVYDVTGVRTKGDPVPAPVDEGASRLTLMTADRGGLQAEQTVYVDATLADDAVPAGRVAAPDPGARPMSGGLDAPTLGLLVLGLQVLVGALAGFAWAWGSWSRAGAWIAGVPCVLAALWLVSSIGSRLLPGLV